MMMIIMVMYEFMIMIFKRRHDEIRYFVPFSDLKSWKNLPLVSLGHYKYQNGWNRCNVFLEIPQTQIGQIPHIATCGTLKVDGSLKHCNLNRFVGPKRRFDIAYKSVTLLEEKANDGVSFSTLSPPPTLVCKTI